MRKLFTILLVLGLFLNTAMAESIPVPVIPDISSIPAEEANELIEQYNSEVEEYNEKVDVYNEAIDTTYTEEYEAYELEKQTVIEHNIAEDQKVAEVNEHNDAEDTKVAQSEEYVRIVAEKVEAEAPGTTVENFTDLPDELPTTWDDTTEELSTIIIEKAEEQSGETIKIINLHLYLGSDLVPGVVFDEIGDEEFTITQEAKDAMIFAEWETAEFDLNDTVTVRSEGIIYKDSRISNNGKNYKVQNYDSRFIRNIEDYTQGVWIPSSEIASNANTLEYGYGYDFETGEGKGGETYINRFTPEERTQYYLENGVMKEETVIKRTVDGTEPKNILSIFTYTFQRLFDEPEVYEPQYEEYTPNYMEEPEEPTKGEYLERLETMSLVTVPAKEEPVKKDEPKPTPKQPTKEEPKEEPIIEPTEEPIIEPIVEPIIEDEPTPAVGIRKWSVFNLICAGITVLFSFLSVILFKRRAKEYDDERVVNSYSIPLSSILISIGAIWLFLITEDMTLPKTIFDEYSPIMAIIGLTSLGISFNKVKIKKS